MFLNIYIGYLSLIIIAIFFYNKKRLNQRKVEDCSKITDSKTTDTKTTVKLDWKVLCEHCKGTDIDIYTEKDHDDLYTGVFVCNSCGIRKTTRRCLSSVFASRLILNKVFHLTDVTRGFPPKIENRKYFVFSSEGLGIAYYYRHPSRWCFQSVRSRNDEEICNYEVFSWKPLLSKV